MHKKITWKYWFVHRDTVGNIYEDENGNRIIVFDGLLEIGAPIRAKDANGNEVDPEEIGLVDLLQSFVVAKTDRG
jgi:hypothetical protein